MKKAGNMCFVAVCLLVCLLPFAGMLVAPTETTTENRKMAEFPELKKDGLWNKMYFQELGAYFEDHLAFRSALVMADSLIQSKVFRVSNMDTVVVGDDGWLYYTATIEDYQGSGQLSERGIYNAAHNISLLQSYVQQRGAEFLFTIAPNKNSLYGENMPYYLETKVSEDKNLQRLEPKLAEFDIVYADLYHAFSQEEETLYLKRDSHWNQKGAVLAYNTILDRWGYAHENYETVPNIRTKTEYGDLNHMIYPLSFMPEWNYSYQKEQDYSYVTDTQSTEDAWIETENDSGEGSLLMFRDSFGNTLLPLMADVFGHGYFSKAEPYKIEEYMDTYTPEYVIVEKVERNISNFATNPPVMTARKVKVEQPSEIIQTETTIDMQEAEADTTYWLISGLVDEQYLQTNTNIYINVTAGDEMEVYEAFSVTKEADDNGYQVYIPKKAIPTEIVRIDVLTDDSGRIQKVGSKEIDMNGLMVPKSSTADEK